MDSLGIPDGLMVRVGAWAAGHNSSVPQVMAEALRTYMEDVDLRLLPPPPDRRLLLRDLRQRGHI